jgi:hypothetical protein
MGKYVAPVVDHLILPAVASLTGGTQQFLRLAGRGIPSPVAVRLLIDIGAKRTTLTPAVINALNPPSGYDVHVSTPLAAGTATLFWVRLDFPGTGLTPFEQVQVACLAMPPGLAQFHGLFGRDLLSRWESFDYQGRRGCYSLRDTPGLFSWLRRSL